MTTKGKPTKPATHDGTTTVLDADAIADASNSETGDAGITRELSAAELMREDAPEAAEETSASPATQPAEDSPLTATTPKMAVTAPRVTEPQTAPGPVADDPGATTHLPVLDADLNAGTADDIPDEIDPEWAMADQPTVQMQPRQPRQNQRPAYLETGEQNVWPPRPSPGTTARPNTLGQFHAAVSDRTPTPTPTPIPRPISRSGQLNTRIPSPTGRQPVGSIPNSFSDPRMRRLVELRVQRGAHAGGQRAPGDNVPVAQMVRQWWSDLLPGLQEALEHQHEARASGVYPIPAHEATPGARFGDAFGRAAAAVRDLSERAQAAAAPALNRLHERAEQAAQALVDRLEGSPVRQQAPFLGPGRLAVFFQQGVTVGQAQRLLMANQARPMRLIPRRHGFLALVQPGREPTVGEQLRRHPYVRDVVYLEYDQNGEPLPAR